MNVKKVFVIVAALFALASLAAEPSAALKIDSLDEVKKIAAQKNLKEIKSGPDDYLAVSEDSKSFAFWRVKDEKDDTFLGRFFLAALAQKSLVTNKIFISGSLLAGFSIDFEKKGFKGIKDFRILAEARINDKKHKAEFPEKTKTEREDKS